MHLSLVILTGTCSLVVGQVVSPYPASNCDSLAGTELQCPNQPGCCSGGAECCAGGCCPLTAICVNSGTANEGCCDLSDESLCGTAVTASAPACPSATGFHASKLCVGADDDWYCAWNAACNYAAKGCIGGRAVRDECGGGATESETDSSTDDSATSTDDFSSTTASIDTSTSASATSESVAAPMNNLSAALVALVSILVGLWVV